MKRAPDWTYMLRILGTSPRTLPMDRLAEYLAEFAALLGAENEPVFAGMVNASAGLKARLPARRRASAWKRLQEAKYRPASRPGCHLRKIEALLGEDAFGPAELKDSADNVIYLFQPTKQADVLTARIQQEGEVDGVVTGMVGADDTMHLYLRDATSRDYRLVVRNEDLARRLLSHFRVGSVRVRVHGHWVRTEDGWMPESGKCTVDAFDVLDETPLSDVLALATGHPQNGWAQMEDPAAAWRALRGIH